MNKRMPIMRALPLCIVLLITCHGKAQDLSDSIMVKRGFSIHFYKNGHELSNKEMLKITKPHPEAFREMKIAKTNSTISTISGISGVACIAWPVAVAINGGQAPWIFAGIGGGLIIGSIPFSRGYQKHALKAMKLYNGGLPYNNMSKASNVNFRFGMTTYGPGVRLDF